MTATFPGGFKPYYRRSWQHISSVIKENICIILISGERHHFTELLNGPGFLSPEYALSQSAGRPESDLFFHQPFLNHLKTAGIQVKKTAIFTPEIQFMLFFQFVCISQAGIVISSSHFFLPKLMLSPITVLPFAACSWYKEGNSLPVIVVTLKQ